MNIKKMKILLIIPLAFILVSCTPDAVVVKTIDVGVVVDVNVVSTSFNESVKTTIKTDKGVFTIRGIPSVFIGSNATIEQYDNGSSYLCLVGWKSCYRVYLP